LFYTIKQMLIKYATVVTVEDKVRSIQSSLEQLKLRNPIQYILISRTSQSTTRTEQVHYRTFVDLLMLTMKLWLTNMILHNKSGNTLIQNIQGLVPSLRTPI
jgi:hypothetical protein